MSREGRLNPIPKNSVSVGRWMFTEEMMPRVPRAKVFATGPDDPLNNRHKLYCKICRVNVCMRAWVVYDMNRPYQSPNHLREDQ